VGRQKRCRFEAAEGEIGGSRVQCFPQQRDSVLGYKVHTVQFHARRIRASAPQWTPPSQAHSHSRGPRERRVLDTSEGRCVSKMSQVHLVTASHLQPDYKLPWMLMTADRYEKEIEWYLITPNIEMSPDEYDRSKGGVKYFHDAISRDEAEARIRQRGELGAFLLRTGSQKQHVISAASKDGIVHIEVKVGPKGGKCLGKGSREFADIAQMMMALFDRPIEGFPVRFEVPVPPSSRLIADELAADAGAPSVKKEKKKKKKKKKTEVRRVALVDLPTYELRALLEQHGIPYHHVNSRVELEQLCNGLEITVPKAASGGHLSGSSLVSMASTDSGPMSPDPSLLPPAAASLLPPPTSSLLPPPATSLLPPSAKASTNESSGAGGMNLFNKYKAKATSPNGGLSAPAAPRGRSSSARMAREKKRAVSPTSKDDLDSPSRPSPSAAAAASPQPSPPKEQRLSAMAADFFGGLMAEATADGGDTTTPSPAVTSSAPLPVVSERPRPPSLPASPAALGPDDDSDEDTDDSDDSESETDTDDESDDDESDTRAFSSQLMQKMAKGPARGRPPPPAGSAAAERQAKRKEKLRAIAQGL